MLSGDFPTLDEKSAEGTLLHTSEPAAGPLNTQWGKNLKKQAPPMIQQAKKEDLSELFPELPTAAPRPAPKSGWGAKAAAPSLAAKSKAVAAQAPAAPSPAPAPEVDNFPTLGNSKASG